MLSLFYYHFFFDQSFGVGVESYLDSRRKDPLFLSAQGLVFPRWGTLPGPASSFLMTTKVPMDINWAHLNSPWFLSSETGWDLFHYAVQINWPWASERLVFYLIRSPLALSIFPILLSLISLTQCHHWNCGGDMLRDPVRTPN